MPFPLPGPGLASHTTEKHHHQTLPAFHQPREGPAVPSDQQALYLKQGWGGNTLAALQQQSQG